MEQVAGITLGKLTVHLLEWQSTADHHRLEILLGESLPLLERFARQTLLRHGIADASAVDDALSLVFDHLRRLPDLPSGQRLVARFTSDRRPRCRCFDGDAGLAYLHWLVRERAIDVARTRRRQSRRAVPFSQLDETAAKGLEKHADPNADSTAGVGPLAEACTRLHEAIGTLEPRLRTVVELLLEGKNQATIAHALDVCEGTVSRLRVRAIEQLRRALTRQD